ncbi:hypothetical protein [Nocardia asteroides]|uniref:hypothetical protein n=1 Tax=Nocardia asteroides TaxID=1824 RepID=UPI001E473D41|nr:hypothetical protein [Nocardia asteroides]UGT61088.1 hypothetical protein LTT61_28780 [Nocardia asteroides]
MTLSTWPDQDLPLLREVAGRIAVVIQGSTDSRQALADFTEALPHAGQLARVLIEYSSRWFDRSSGDSTMMGPELFWTLTEFVPPALPQNREQGGTEYHHVERTRHLLLICVLEQLAVTQFAPAAQGGDASTRHRYGDNAVPVLTSRLRSAPDVEGTA